MDGRTSFLETWLPKNVSVVTMGLNLGILLLMIRFQGFFNIDWTCYMEQIGIYQTGDLDYLNYNSRHGPCVYGGAYIYIFDFLHRLTEEGKNLLRAQWIFLVLDLVEGFILLKIYMAAIKVGDKERKITYNESIFIVLMTLS